MAALKCSDFILDAIEKLRKREKQPNLNRLCQMLRRRHGLNPCAVSKELEKLVTAGSIIEVYFSKNKIHCTAAGGENVEIRCYRGFYVTSYVTSVILDIIRTLTVTKDHSQSKRAFLLDILQCLDEREINPFSMTAGTLRTVLNREVSKGNLRRLHAGGFVLDPRPVADSSYESSSSSDEDSESILDNCNFTAAAHRKGTAEELLKCRDSGEKAHPSCMESMEYESLPEPQSLQCPEYKAPTCVVCEKATNLDDMLTCDVCFTNYHKLCHDPAVLCEPTGLWGCANCNAIEMEWQKNKKFKADQSSDKCEPPAVSLDDEFSNSSIEKYLTTVPMVDKWTIENVESFIQFLGFKDEAPVFREQKIDGMSLLLMNRSDVVKGLGLKLGPALKIYMHIVKLHSCVPNN